MASHILMHVKFEYFYSALIRIINETRKFWNRWIFSAIERVFCFKCNSWV